MNKQTNNELGEEIPLAWQPQLQNRVSAIEVYPAATLLAHHIPHEDYKKRKVARAKALEYLCEKMALNTSSELLIEADDIFDACICLLAGGDFLEGKCVNPVDLTTARKEGWIWVRDPELIM